MKKIFIAILFVCLRAEAQQMMLNPGTGMNLVSTLAWSAQISARVQTVSGTTGTTTMTNGAASGSSVAVIVAWKNTTSGAPSGVSDPRGNTYTLRWSTTNSAIGLAGYSSKLSSSILANDAITVTYDTSGTYFTTMWVGQVLNSAAVDSSGTNSTTGSTVSVLDTVGATPTVAVGALLVPNGSQPYTVGNFSSVSVLTNGDGSVITFQQKALTGTGSKDMGGTLGSAASYEGGWSAFK